MIYRLENRKINLDKMVPTSNFKDGYIYNISKLSKPSILKFYSKNFNELPDEDQMRYFTKIRSIHILLPTKLLFANDKFSGYTLKSVSKNGIFGKMITTPKDVLIDNLCIMEDEIKELSKRSIILKGMNHQDTVYNGELFITNPDNYLVIDNNNSDTTLKIEDVNTFLFNNLLQEIFSHELNGEKVNKSSINKFSELLSQKDLIVKNSDYMDDIIDSENIREYVKRI